MSVTLDELLSTCESRGPVIKVVHSIHWKLLSGMGWLHRAQSRLLAVSFGCCVIALWFATIFL
jgi:hypothetical protein